MNVPLIFTKDLRDDTGYGLVVYKEFGASEFLLRNVTPRGDSITRLDFVAVYNLLQDIVNREEKEVRQRSTIVLSQEVYEVEHPEECCPECGMLDHVCGCGWEECEQ